MKIVLTGISGFVGRSFFEYLRSDLNLELLIISRSKLNFIKSFQNIKILYEDLNNHEKISFFIKRFKPDGIIHLAWIGVYNFSHMLPCQENNYVIIKRLLEIGKESSIKFFISLGSQAEYGLHEDPIKESFKTRPETLYGKMKLKSALYAQKFCKENGIRFVWLRLFSSYGPFDNPKWLIPYVICNCLKSNKILVTKATQKWDYLYVEDVALTIYKCIYADIDGIYNLGSGIAVEIREIILKIRDLINPQVEIEFGAIPFKENQIYHLQADISFLQKNLTYHNKFPLEIGLKKTIEHYKKFGF